jgi:outer membrane protein
MTQRLNFSLRALLALAGGALASLAAAAPLSLDDAIKLALQNNQNVKVSAFGPQIGRANVTAAYGTFDPVLTFNRSYEEDETPGLVAPPGRRRLDQADHYSLSLDGSTPWGMSYSLGGRADNPRNSTTGFLDNYVTFGGVSVTQPLLRGFGFTSALNGLRVAKANRGINDWQHKLTVINTVTSVIVVFNNLQEARENLKISQLARDLAAKTHGDNKKRLEIGATSQAEVVQSEAGVANREEAILISQRRVADTENQLRLLVGDTSLSVNGPPLEIVELAPAPDISVDAAADLKKAYDLRPDYQMERLGLTIDRHNNALAQMNLLPTVNFVGSYGYSGVSSNFRAARDQVRDEDARSYSAGLVVRIPLTFTQDRGRARAAKLNLRQGEANLVRVEQDIAFAVTAAAGQIETTKKRVAATKIAVDLAGKQLENEQKRFQTGASTTFLLTQAQQNLSLAQNSYARAVADQRRAIATYEQQLGTTLITHNIVVP